MTMPHEWTAQDMAVRIQQQEWLIESYQNLVGVLLDHTSLHEGTDRASGAFLSSGDPAAVILERIINAQSEEWKETHHPVAPPERPKGLTRNEVPES